VDTFEETQKKLEMKLDDLEREKDDIMDRINESKN
jgi:hypothetical protein